MDTLEYFVVVTVRETNEAHQVLGPMSERKADKVMDGMLHRFDLDQVDIEIIEKSKVEALYPDHIAK